MIFSNHEKIIMNAILMKYQDIGCDGRNHLDNGLELEDDQGKQVNSFGFIIPPTNQKKGGSSLVKFSNHENILMSG